MAKKFHPDTAKGDQKQNLEQFKAVTEAYTILSQPRTRLDYDANIGRFNQFPNRGKDGQSLMAQALKESSYAQRRKEELAMERKRFNVDVYGRYRGGLPRPNNGSVRGDALGNPGEFHDPTVHNMLTENNMDFQHVDEKRSQQFSEYKQGDREWVTRRRVWWLAEVDYNFFKFEHYQNAWKIIAWVSTILVLLPYLGTQLESSFKQRTLGQFLNGKLNQNTQNVKVTQDGALILERN